MSDEAPKTSTGPTPVTLADITATPVDLIKRSLVKACLAATKKARGQERDIDEPIQLTTEQKIHKAAQLLKFNSRFLSGDANTLAMQCCLFSMSNNLDPKKVWSIFQNMDKHLDASFFLEQLQQTTKPLPIFTVVRITKPNYGHGEAINNLLIIINGKTTTILDSSGGVDKQLSKTSYVIASDLEVQTCISVLSAPQIRRIMSEPIFDTIVTEAFGLEEDFMGKVTVGPKTFTY